MSAKYTPGPWELDTSKCADWGMILADDGFPVAKCVTTRDSEQEQKMARVQKRQPAQCYANARLIAAAPQLLEACEALLVEWAAMERVHGEHGWREVTMARAAIAKVKGIYDANEI